MLKIITCIIDFSYSCRLAKTKLHNTYLLPRVKIIRIIRTFVNYGVKCTFMACVLDSLLVENKWDKESRKTFQVKICATIRQSMEIDIDLLFRNYWNVTRCNSRKQGKRGLKYSKGISNGISSNLKFLSNNATFASWMLHQHLT